jgi:hypothetical protein
VNEAMHVSCCRRFIQNTCESGENTSKNFLLIKNYIQMIMSKLISAHLIIKILEEETKAEFVKAPITSTHPKSAYEKSENERIEVRNNCHNKIKTSPKHINRQRANNFRDDPLMKYNVQLPNLSHQKETQYPSNRRHSGASKTAHKGAAVLNPQTAQNRKIKYIL